MKAKIDTTFAPLQNDKVVTIEMSIAEAQLLAHYIGSMPAPDWQGIAYKLYSSLNDVGFEPLPGLITGGKV